MSSLNVSQWNDSGFAVYFSFMDLRLQKRLSEEPGRPWKLILDDIIEIARMFRLVYVTMWYPNQFGSGVTIDELRNHSTIVQQVFPTRTGLNSLKSTVTVWRVESNYTDELFLDVATKTINRKEKHLEL